MKKIILFFTSIVLATAGFSQQAEPMFTQFYNSPLQINPANAGLFSGRARIITNYKRQWDNIGEPFQTIAGSGDFQLARNVTGGDFFGMGIDITQDKAGKSELTNFSGNVSLSFTKAFDSKKEHFGSVGFQGGYSQRSLSANGLNWGSQWTQYGFDQSILSPDAGMDEAVSYFDLAVGVNYFYAQSDDKVKFYLGVAMYHVAEPKISFLGDDNIVLSRKYNINSGLRFLFGRSDDYALFPSMIYSWQGTSYVLIYGADFEYRIDGGSRSSGTRKYTSFAVGLYHRWDQTISPVVKLHKAGFSLYVSYDFEVGNITRVTNGMGGMEISLKYRVGFRDGRDKRNINNAFL